MTSPSCPNHDQGVHSAYCPMATGDATEHVRDQANRAMIAAYVAYFDAVVPCHEWGDDRVDEFTEAIKAAHPLRTGGHNCYAQAMMMVGNRHSKGALVELVNWLLMRAEEAEKK